MLADWMQSLLEDMEFSRSVPLATFLELERASRKGICGLFQEIYFEV